MAIRESLLLLLLWSPLLAVDQVTWHTDLDAALREAADRPLALLFSTEQCVWCKRMVEESSASAAVRQVLTQVVGVLVHAQERPALVAQLGIQGYPTLVLVNRKRELVRIVPGYLPETDLVTTLKVLALRGDQDGQGRIELDERPDIEAIRRSEGAVEHLVALLGTGTQEQRRHVREALAGMPQAREALWRALDNQRLGVRVDASAALARQVGAPRSYDPLSVGEERTAAIAAWKAQAQTTLPGGLVP
jgi:thioredoxin-related protein